MGWDGVGWVDCTSGFVQVEGWGETLTAESAGLSDRNGPVTPFTLAYIRLITLVKRVL